MKTAPLIIALCVFVLTGCAGFGQSNLSAAQLTALAKDKSIGVMTNEVSGIWGTLKSKVVNVDKSVLIDGVVTVSPDGSVSISNRTNSRPAGATALVSVPVLVQAAPVSPGPTIH